MSEEKIESHIIPSEKPNKVFGFKEDGFVQFVMEVNTLLVTKTSSNLDTTPMVKSYSLVTSLHPDAQLNKSAYLPHPDEFAPVTFIGRQGDTIDMYAFFLAYKSCMDECDGYYIEPDFVKKNLETANISVDWPKDPLTVKISLKKRTYEKRTKVATEPYIFSATTELENEPLFYQIACQMISWIEFFKKINCPVKFELSPDESYIKNSNSAQFLHILAEQVMRYVSLPDNVRKSLIFAVEDFAKCRDKDNNIITLSTVPKHIQSYIRSFPDVITSCIANGWITEIDKDKYTVTEQLLFYLQLSN